MKRKYYLRGLGFGILITTLVFIITNPSGLTDDEIIKRAEELGYIKAEEQTGSLGIKELLGTATPDPEEVHTVILPEPSVTPSKTPTPVPTETPIPEPTSVPTETPEPTNTPVPTETPVPTQAPATVVVTATIVVERGNTASMVCNKIEAAGIVKSGNALRDYLVAHDLADYINIGSYTLSADMSLEEIAAIITER